MVYELIDFIWRNDLYTYLDEASSKDSNYFRSFMRKIDCFNRDFHEQLPCPVYFIPEPLYLNPNNKIPVYDPIMLNELKKRLSLDYKMAEIPQDVFEYGTSYYKKISETYQFIKKNHGVLLYSKQELGITPLMVAAARIFEIGDLISRALEERLESIKIMLRDRTVDINQQDIFGRTALMHVVLRLYEGFGDMPGKEVVSKLSLEHGADPFVTDVLGKSALDYFLEYCGKKHPAYLLLLEKSNALVSESAVQTCSPIALASESAVQTCSPISSTGFFKKLARQDLYMNRNDNASSQIAFDKEFGLVPYSKR